jgi:hypothetical protein
VTTKSFGTIFDSTEMTGLAPIVFSSLRPISAGWTVLRKSFPMDPSTIHSQAASNRSNALTSPHPANAADRPRWR